MRVWHYIKSLNETLLAALVAIVVIVPLAFWQAQREGVTEFHVGPGDKIIKFLGKEYGPYEVESDDYTKVRSVYYPILGQETTKADESVMLNFYIQGVWGDEIFSASGFANQFINDTQDEGDYIVNHFEAPDPFTKEPAFMVVSYASYPDIGYGYAFVSKITSIGTDVYSVMFSKRFFGQEKDLQDKITEWIRKDGISYLTAVAHTRPDDAWIGISDSFPLSTQETYEEDEPNTVASN